MFSSSLSLYADQSGIISIDEIDLLTNVTDLFLIGFLVAEKKKGEVKHPDRTDTETVTVHLQLTCMWECY